LRPDRTALPARQRDRGDTADAERARCATRRTSRHAGGHTGRNASSHAPRLGPSFSIAAAVTSPAAQGLTRPQSLTHRPRARSRFSPTALRRADAYPAGTMSALAACSAPVCRARPPTALGRRMRHRAFGVIGMVLLLAWQSAATCHDAHLAARQDAAIGALIAASLCSTVPSSATASPLAPSPADAPISGDPYSPGAGSPGTGSPGPGCLHCASGGCSASASRLVGGWLVAALSVAALVGTTAAPGESGASAWRNGHPVRGPPQSGV
jgi:hypothetical protein